MKSKLLVTILLGIFFAPCSLWAQGLFQGTGIPATVIGTGQTEVIGLIVVSMTQGPAVAGTLVVDVSPLQITNANAADITVTAFGLTVGAATIDTTNNLVQIPVQAGGSATASIRIEGIRVAVAGTGINSFNAKLSWQNSLNAFLRGTSVPVINTVSGGLVVQPITDPRGTSRMIHLSESYSSAFSSSSQFGQTGSTKIRIRITDFPDGAQILF